MSPFAMTTEALLSSAGLPTNRLPTHPGQVLSLEYLKPRGLSQVKVAKAVGIRRPYLNQIIHGKRRMTAEYALVLGRYFGCPASTWLNLQHAYDLAVAIRQLPPKRLASIQPHRPAKAGE